MWQNISDYNCQEFISIFKFTQDYFIFNLNAIENVMYYAIAFNVIENPMVYTVISEEMLNNTNTIFKMRHSLILYTSI